VKVKNLNGTGDNEDVICGSWLEHYRKQEDIPVTQDLYCAVEGPTHIATHGGHVQKADPNDRSWYIVPLCDQHNVSWKGDTLNISDDVPLVPANIAETCDREKRAQLKRVVAQYLATPTGWLKSFRAASPDVRRQVRRAMLRAIVASSGNNRTPK
jgi:hypothetical protein